MSDFIIDISSTMSIVNSLNVDRMAYLVLSDRLEYSLPKEKLNAECKVRPPIKLAALPVGATFTT